MQDEPQINSNINRPVTPHEPDAAESNLDRLLTRMGAADEPDPDFVQRVRERLVREARTLAAERHARPLPPRAGRWWRGGLTLAACSLAGVLLAATAYRLGVRSAQDDRPNHRPHQPAMEVAADARGHDPNRADPGADPVTTATTTDAVATGAAVESPAEPEPSIETRVFSVVGPEGAVCVSYDDIDAEKLAAPAASLGGSDWGGSDWAAELPPRLRTLAGRRIRIRGFMVPAFEESGLRRFVLSRDNEACCFGPNPRPCDVIPVTLRDGTTTDYIEGRPFDVVGTFRVDPEAAPDGRLERLYVLQDALVVGR